ncbi:uncharacterized protein BO97DRAFT_404312 [Aspergillus homomorphus CBS 101889]|uniref:Uncharacterized protein n=1 Tax=Aspergillus homomorphus (strain CBS 101889) TaxID=1450537 RepID=A0A395I443_ASPHC|nr:hypothetical protein BO97DRAFT_404312 [Aspergillus homomorphus CBS 101889]RAL14373.1 hypothetical protein BO97DRAFT_404312 [Aspergillus homomorphus CBS 101889]
MTTNAYIPINDRNSPSAAKSSFLDSTRGFPSIDSCHSSTYPLDVELATRIEILLLFLLPLPLVWSLCTVMSSLSLTHCVTTDLFSAASSGNADLAQHGPPGQ